MTREPVPVPKPLTLNQWYRDPETDHEYKLLKVHAETVEIADHEGERRTVNRMLWERDMKEMPQPKGAR